MTQQSAHQRSGSSARVAENGSKPVITTGSLSRRSLRPLGWSMGARLSRNLRSQPMRHEEYMKTRMREEEEKAKSRLTKSLPETFSDDLVNSPSHYNQSGIECIDAIRAALGPEAFRNYCTGNALKYIWRHPYKNGKQDVEKAIVYLQWLKEAYDE